MTFVAEIRDLTRFAHPRALMSYSGLVPSEFSRGNSRRQGAITCCGNKHARRILVEAAWNNRLKAQFTRTLDVRQQSQPKVIRDIARRAQLRLSKRWRSLSMGRKTQSEQDLRRPNSPASSGMSLGTSRSVVGPAASTPAREDRPMLPDITSVTPNWKRDARDR